MIMRWSVWIAAAGAVLISGTTATAQYRSDYYPGYNSGYYQGQYNQPYGWQSGPDVAAHPRPDFPGPYQSETSRRYHKRSSANK
jgi:hypothetical protein